MASSARKVSSTQQQQVIHVVGPTELSSVPQVMTCPKCHHSVETSTKMVNGNLTWLVCLGLMLVTSFTCCCLAFFSDCTKDVEHRCPNCQYFFGTHKRLQ